MIAVVVPLHQGPGALHAEVGVEGRWQVIIHVADGRVADVTVLAGLPKNLGPDALGHAKTERVLGVLHEPQLVGDGPNTMSTHWQFSVAANGNIYFNSGDPGGLGAGDLYVSRFVDGRYTDPVNLGELVNSEFSEDRPFIAPDESYLLFARLAAPDGFGRTDLYVSFRNDDGTWTRPRNMGPRVNSPANEGCPIVSPDGRYLFFNSHRNGNADNYWMEAAIIDSMRSDR